MQRHPNLKEERKLWRRGYKRVAGTDEAGVGPLAGPVVAAAVVIKISNIKYQISATAPPNHPFVKEKHLITKIHIKNKKIFREIRDSKQLTPKKREEIFEALKNCSKIKWSVASVSSGVIDKIGIRRATELAVIRCIQKLKPRPDFIIFDGNRLISRKLEPRSYKLLVKADEKVVSCALASIVAKVTRDRKMMRLHKKFPMYHFDFHKGYGTKLHLKMLKKHGPCEIHRKSFKPVIK